MTPSKRKRNRQGTNPDPDQIGPLDLFRVGTAPYLRALWQNYRQFISWKGKSGFGYQLSAWDKFFALLYLVIILTVGLSLWQRF